MTAASNNSLTSD